MGKQKSCWTRSGRVGPQEMELTNDFTTDANDFTNDFIGNNGG